MAGDDREPLLRLPPPRSLFRKKRRPSFPPPPKRVPATHAAALRTGAHLVREHLRAAEERFPSLATDVPYVRLDVAPKTVLSDIEVKSLGLIPVHRRERSVIAAYSTDHALSQLDAQVDSYASERRKLAALAKIERISPWTSEDRTSERLKAIRIDPKVEYIVDVLLLPLEDDVPNPQAVRAVESFVSTGGGEVLDRALERSFTALRVRLGGQSLAALLEFRDDVAEVDLPPRAQVVVPAITGFSIDSVPELSPPDPTAPAICVVDSGLLEGHPLLEPAVLSARSRSFPEELGPPIPVPLVDGAGHGTHVAGIALYEDVAAAVAAKAFLPQLWLLNARVLDDNAKFHPRRMPFLRSVVEHARDRCRVFNLSYGMEPCRGYLSPHAVELDELTREYDVLSVVSAGNRVPDGDPIAIANAYPAHLKASSWRVLGPAEALTALTVGAITPDGDPSSADRTAGAPKRAPAPFSLAGGLKNVVKPEVVEVGGNIAYAGSPPRWVSSDPSLDVPTTSHRLPEGQLLTFTNGTSIAAPKVSHLAARILERYPEASANMLRALVVNSAVFPEGVAGWKDSDILATCGFGVPVSDRALFCRPNRVTLYYEGVVQVDEVKVFDVPVPPELARSRGEKVITVTLAYDPPVSAVDRDRPAGIRLTWGLARGDVPEKEVERAIAAEAEADVAEPVSSVEPERPTSKTRSVFMTGRLPKRPQQRGAVQKNRFVWSRGEYGDTYRLAVTAKATRPRHAEASQRFALVATLESEDTSVNLYTLIRTRLAAARVRVQITA